MQLINRWRPVLGALALIATMSTGLEASARDNARRPSTEQRQLAKNLPRTVVIRIKKGTHKVEIAQLRQQLAPGKTAKAIAKKAKFAASDRSGRMAPAYWTRADWDFSCGEYYRYDNYYERSRYYDDYDRYDYSYDTDYWYYQPVYSYGSYNYPYSRYYGYSDGVYDYSFYGWAYDGWWY